MYGYGQIQHENWTRLRRIHLKSYHIKQKQKWAYTHEIEK